MKYTKLPFTLLMMATILHAQDITKDNHPSLNTPQSQVANMPARIQGILHSQADKFNQVEHHYPLLVPLTIVKTILYAGAIITMLVLGYCFFSAFDKDTFSAIIFGIFIAVALVLASAFKNHYNKNQHPGHCCLTDTGLFIIPAGKGDKFVWIPYHTILLTRQCMTIFWLDADEHAYKANQLNYMLKHLNKKKQLDSQDRVNLINAMRDDIDIYGKAAYRTLFILFKDGDAYRLNTECTAKTLQSLENYKNLCEELKKKTKAYRLQAS